MDAFYWFTATRPEYAEDVLLGFLSVNGQHPQAGRAGRPRGADALESLEPRPADHRGGSVVRPEPRQGARGRALGIHGGSRPPGVPGGAGRGEWWGRSR